MRTNSRLCLIVYTVGHVKKLQSLLHFNCVFLGFKVDCGIIRQNIIDIDELVLIKHVPR